MCLCGLNATGGNEVLMHCGIDVCVWPEIVLCNGPVSGGGWGGQGVTGEKVPVWTALRVNIFAPTFTKDLTKKRERKGGGVSGRRLKSLHDWTISNTFQLHLLHTQEHAWATAPYHSHTDAFTHELHRRSVHQPVVLSSVHEDDSNFWLQSTYESGPDWN